MRTKEQRETIRKLRGMGYPALSTTDLESGAVEVVTSAKLPSLAPGVTLDTLVIKVHRHGGYVGRRNSAIIG